MGVEAFGIEKEFLKDLLTQVDRGETQLPEFQRGWVWPDRNIASLIASISLGYPAGTVMMLRQGGETRFKTRAVEGAQPSSRTAPDRLILDGQQRLTSLYQSIHRKAPVETQDVRGKDVKGWFYLDMERAVLDDGDREDAIVFVPETKVRLDFRGRPVLDLSTSEKEFAARMFPCTSLFDSMPWMMGFFQFDPARQNENLKLWGSFHDAVVQRFIQYQLPVIELGRSTPRQAVCQVFEKVNTGGVTLTVFELLTATFAADDFDLRQDWDDRRKSWTTGKYDILANVANTDFLQAVALLATIERRQAAIEAGRDEASAPRIGCRRADMLNLTLPEYLKWAPDVTEGLKAAAQFLHAQHIFDTRFLPYGSQLIPMAAVFALLRKQADTVGARQKISRWYWCGVFGELYGGTTETRFARDVPDLVDWVRGAETEPRTVQEAQFVSGRLWSLRTRGSAAYKGIYALLLRESPLDWCTGSDMSDENYFDNAVDIHHIFPKVWCEKAGIDANRYNSIVNKTPLTARTNRIIGGRPPSVYLRGLAKNAETTPETIDRNVRSHQVSAADLRNDDFETVVSQRERALLSLISRVMGKEVQTDSPVDNELRGVFSGGL
ncbi:GmrSD restriction endonuclease domain-containing protein [Amycolatopsis sp. NPDC003731]